jgi:hypothetical protein
MNSRNGEDALIWKRELYIARCGELALEEALHLSWDRLLSECITYFTISFVYGVPEGLWHTAIPLLPPPFAGEESVSKYIPAASSARLWTLLHCHFNGTSTSFVAQLGGRHSLKWDERGNHFWARYDSCTRMTTELISIKQFLYSKDSSVLGNFWRCCAICR